MRVSLISFILNFVKCWFVPFPFYEWHCRISLYKELRSIVKSGSLKARLILWYSGRKGLRYYLVRSPFQLIHFLMRLPPKIAFCFFIFFQFVLYLLIAVPRALVSVFVYIYNVSTFSFFFITSQLFLIFDTLQLFVRMLLEPIVSVLKLTYYKLLSFMVRNNLIVILYFAHSIFFWLVSFLAIVSILSLFFYQPDLFVVFSHYVLGLGKFG